MSYRALKKSSLVLFLLLLPVVCSAEKIELTNGDIVVGKIIDRSQYDIRVDTGVGLPIYYYWDDIKNINGIPFQRRHKGLVDAPLADSPRSQPQDMLLPEEVEDSFQNKEIFKKIKFYVEDDGKIKLYPGNFEEEIGPLYNETLNREKQLDDLVRDLNSQGAAGIEIVANEDEPVKREFSKTDDLLLRESDLRQHVNIFAAIRHFVFELLLVEFNFIKNCFKSLEGVIPGVYEFIYAKINNVKIFYSSQFSPMALKGLVIYALLVYYLAYSFPLMRLAKVFETGKYWMAWVPGLQEVLVVRMANKNLWWLLLYLIPFVRFFNIIYLWSEISYYIFKPKWCAFLMIIPGVNLIVLWNYSFFYRELR